VTWVTSALTYGCVSGAVSLFQHKEQSLVWELLGALGNRTVFPVCVEFFHSLAAWCLRSINRPYHLALGINFT